MSKTCSLKQHICFKCKDPLPMGVHRNQCLACANEDSRDRKLSKQDQRQNGIIWKAERKIYAKALQAEIDNLWFERENGVHKDS